MSGQTITMSDQTILLSQYHTVRGGATTNYAKKSRPSFLPCIFFSYGILDKIRRLHKIYFLCAFIFFIFGHHVET